MSYNSYKDKLSVRKINYNFVMNAHIYYNANSKNRVSDSSPMFYLKPIKVLHVEKVAFSRNAETKNYFKYGNRFWRYKPASELSDEQIEQYFLSIKNSYPYGFTIGDEVSKIKYDQEVKFNNSFQSFYKKYWFNHLDKVKQPQKHRTESGGIYEDYPHPYIEYEVNEIITAKFPKGNYDVLPDRLLYSDYVAGASIYSQPDSIFCESKNIDVSVRKEFKYDSAEELGYSIKPNLYLNGSANYPLSLGRNKTYIFHLNSGYHWPTGENGNYSGYTLDFSTGEEGVHNGFQKYDVNVQRFAIPSPDVSFAVEMGAKTEEHPYFSQGFISGYCINSNCEGVELSLTRGDKYSFIQTGSSEDVEHPIYIATNPFGEGTLAYSEGVNVIESSGERILDFTVPYDSPNTLYYACKSHAYMGGTLNIVDPSNSSGSLPMEAVRASFNVENDVDTMYYYVNEVSGMGGEIRLLDGCS